MDNLLEILVPLIFAAVYFFGNLLSGKSEDEGAGPPKLPHQPGGHGEAEDYAERQRQIQEAIRRKIMQRRQAATEAQETPEPEAPVIVRQQQQKEVREQHKEVQQRKVPEVEPTPAAPVTSEAPSGAFSWDTSDNVYEEQMQERLQQIEDSKRRAEVLRRQAGLKPAATSANRSAVAERGRRTRGGLLAGPVRKVLRDPAAARVGFIYGEVLGKPVSLRQSGSGVAD